MDFYKKWLFLGLFFGPVAAVFPQNTDPVFQNNVWLDDIRTVQFRGSDKLPFVPLRGSISLQFDLLGDEPANFLYQIIHCDADWTPSNLQESEFQEGFSENSLRDYDLSLFAQQKFVHYQLRLPNADVRWTKSGNYLLKVFLDDDEKTLALTRRFVVFEENWPVEVVSAVPSRVSKMQTHHELDIFVNQKKSRPVNPREVWLSVLQNGRWDNALNNVHEHTVTADGLSYDYQDSIVFPAGKEFRYFDISTFDYKTERVSQIDLRGKWPEIWLRPDLLRGDSPGLNLDDNNGEYEVFLTNPNPGRAVQPLLQSDYALVHFQLKRQSEVENGEVYLFGGLTDWQIQPQFRCKYDENEHVYFGEAYLKQGIYNYEYVIFDPKTGKIDHAELEGNWFATTSRYSVIVYYRPHGERYDRVMGFRTIVTSKS